ncbi:DUF2029 domain-containing protein [Candidatus Daviesbacteria bacterium]|nr:DUF2029 domain-containing protein [Candidatus Daviesbacteria bacterium]
MKKLWLVLIIGISLRVFLSLSTFHSDILAFKLGGELIASGKILNLYDYSNPRLAVLNYPPLIYWFHGLFNFLFGWLLNTNLLVKLPYLMFDLPIGFLLMKLFNNEKQAKLAFVLWMFNPISLYATYMMGQFDIIPTFFVILSVYFALKDKLNWSAVSLGFGIAFKIFPVFLIIPLIIVAKNYRERFKLLVLSFVPYLLSVLPYLSSQSFRTTALFANQNSKSFYANIPVSGGESIILFPMFLLFFYLLILNIRIKTNIWKLYTIPLLLFFIFTHYHPQWLIWLTPLLIVDLVVSGLKHILVNIIIFLTWFFSLFFFDPSLTVGMFPAIAGSLQNMPSIWTFLKINIDYNLARSFLQTAFSASALFLIYQYFPNEQSSSSNKKDG